jgi:ATP-dependent RNA helicase SUPV3L1/SUV3
MGPIARPGRVTAVLGPTNTGKTHFAMERMLGHASGMIGFPLRLLARENYDRIARIKGVDQVALITGEERIAPPSARWIVATVEAMPVDRTVAFLAVDEVQLAADCERGHIFTDRLLNARGAAETMLLGSDTARPLLRRLLGDALQVVARPRLSTLSYAGPRKLSRLPRRSAVVAFSAEDVYRLAEVLRRQRGGCAVVMGALSPRARNAQVALFQSGEVDHMVATDAIGMGLNMDLDHVAFARLSKFDGHAPRRLTPAEIGQIAGRAGRHARDGAFGPTAELGPFDPDLVEAIEEHRFDPLTRLWWRNAELEFRSVSALLASLDRAPPDRMLLRKRDADDHRALAALARLPEVAARAVAPAIVRRLWEVCSVPDFTKLLGDGHVRLLAGLFDHLTGPTGRLPADWVARRFERLDRMDGDIDTLSARLAHVRTWAYVAQREGWLDDAESWRERARDLEDRLSDALHARLTDRFVDRRGAHFIQKLADPDLPLLVGVKPCGEVVVEGFPIGRLEGFRFLPDPRVAGLDARRLMTAARRALGEEIARRVRSLVDGPDARIALDAAGRMTVDGLVVGRLVAGPEPRRPRVALQRFDLLDPAAAERVRRRLSAWVEATLSARLAALDGLAVIATSGAGRGLAFRLGEGLGVAALDGPVTLDPGERRAFAKAGVRVGRRAAWQASALSGDLAGLRHQLLAIAIGADPLPPSGLGRRRVRPEPGDLAGYRLSGYRIAGPVGLRVDVADLVEGLLRRAGRRAHPANSGIPPRLVAIAGCAPDELPALVAAFGWRAAVVDGGVRLRPRARRAPAPRLGDPLGDATSEAADSPFAALARLRVAVR